MSEYRYMRSEVVVKPKHGDDVALRIWCDSLFAEGFAEHARAEQRQRILDELVRRDLIFATNHGELWNKVYPTIGFKDATAGDVQVETIDLSF